MAKISWTAIAESDLEHIIYYIARKRKSLAFAEKFYWEIRNKIVDISKLQINGQVHSGTPPGWLYVKHKRWLLFYKQDEDEVVVLRVIDGARDVPKRLRDLEA